MKPEGRRCEVDGYCNEHVLYLAQIAWIYSRGNEFDFWSYDLCDWVQLDRPSQAISLEKGFDTCLLRVRGVICHAFGTALSYAETSNSASIPCVPPSQAIGDAMPGSLWTLIWTEVSVLRI